MKANKMPESVKISDLPYVSEYTEGYPLELRLRGEEMRVVLRAYNEGGNGIIEIDLFELLGWLRSGQAQDFCVKEGGEFQWRTS